MTWVRITELGHTPGKAKQDINLLATAMTELAIVQALKIVHHSDAYVQKRYIEMGGHIRFNEAGEPVIWREDR